MFSLIKKPLVMSLEMLDEPSYLFDADGAFAQCNDQGKDFLIDMGYNDQTSPQNLETFLSVLHSCFNINQKGRFFHENWHYKICQSKSSNCTLVRLTMVRRNETVTRLSMSLNIMPWGIMTVNLDDQKKIIYCNPKAGEFLNVSHENLIGFSIQDVLSVCGIEEDLSSYINSDIATSYEHHLKLDDKSSWTRFYFNPFMGDYRYCMVVVQDITEEKMKERQYTQAQRLESLGQLAGGVAHDFNNILSIIDGYARLSKKNIVSSDITYLYLDHITKAVERGSGLTSRLLTFGKNKIINEKVIDLGLLIKDQMPLISPLMDASISVNFNVDDDVFVEVSPEYICQILFNLCVNARDAMTNGGNLMVEVRKTLDNKATIQVIDTGCGIPQDVLEKMFDPFYSTKEAGKGTGLGLSMVYSLVQDMKGSIDVSTEVGSGTAMTIILPLSTKRSEISDKFKMEDGTQRVKNITALIAEDEPELLNLVSIMMEEIGVHVIRAQNGNEALALQEEYDGDIDFLLTDVIMPELNGVKLAELFLSCRPESHVLFMSGYPANGQMARVTLPKDAVLMSKPINFEKLKKAIVGLSLKGNDNSQDSWKSLTSEWSVA